MEISTCKYEVIILTNKLCTHPAFKPKPKKNKQIHCYNVDEDANAKPLALQEMEKSHESTFKNVVLFIYFILFQEYVIKVLSDIDTEALKEAVQDLLKDVVDETPMRLLGEKRTGW